MNILYPLLFCYLLLGFSQGTNITAKQAKKQLSDEALLDTVQHRTFRYFWEGAEPTADLHANVSTWMVSILRTIKI